MAAEAEVEAEACAAEHARFEQDEMQLADGIENERARCEHEREELSAQAMDQVAAAANGLRALVQRIDVPLFSRKSGLGVHVDALRRHLEKQTESVRSLSSCSQQRSRNELPLSHELETTKGEI